MFAIILWSYVAGDQNPTITRTIRNVPVDIQNESVLKNRNLIRMDTSIQEVNVKIEGRRSDVAAFKPYDIKAVADISAVTNSGKHQLLVKITNVPSNIRIVDISPKYIEVTIEDIVSNQLPIELKLQGEPKEGHRALDADIVPSDVIVTGPRSLVSKAASAAVQLDITNAATDITRSLPIVIYDERGKEIIPEGLSLSSSFAKVSQKIKAVKTVPIKVNTSNKLPDGLSIVSISAEPSDIIIAGADDDIAQVNAIDTEPIDLSKIQANSTVKAQLVLPEGIELVDQVPIMVSINVAEKNAQKEVKVTEVVIENLPSGLAVSDKPSGLSLLVSGPYTAVNALKASDIKVILNAAGMSRGQHSVVPTVVLPNGLNVVKVEPSSVTLTLK